MRKQTTTPRYQEIADDLVQLIHSGQVSVGQMLPTEGQLCASYGVSRSTAREALRVVRLKGLVERRQGSGTRVTARDAPWHQNQAVQTIEDLLQYGNSTRLVIERAITVAAPVALAPLLECARGRRVLRLSGMRCSRASDPPLCLTEIWLPPNVATRDRALRDLKQAVPALVRLFDLRRLARVEQTLEAENLNKHEAQRLEVEPGTAALRAQGRYFTTDGALLAVVMSLHPKQRFSYFTVLHHEAR